VNEAVLPAAGQAARAARYCDCGRRTTRAPARRGRFLADFFFAAFFLPAFLFYIAMNWPPVVDHMTLSGPQRRFIITCEPVADA
jgi:hypothetical protein